MAKLSSTNELQSNADLQVDQTFHIRLNVSYLVADILPVRDIANRLEDLRRLEQSFVTNLLNRKASQGFEYWNSTEIHALNAQKKFYTANTKSESIGRANNSMWFN